MHDFEIILVNEKLKSYRFITLLILLLHTILFFYLLFDEKLRAYSFLSIVIIAIYLVLFYFLQKRNKKDFFIDSKVYLFFALFWIEIGNYWLFAIVLVLGFFYHISLQKTRLLFNAGMIIKQNFPKKNFYWNQFENIILKDNFLTLNFKNDHFIQGEVENNIDEMTFNNFAENQIKNLN